MIICDPAPSEVTREIRITVTSGATLYGVVHAVMAPGELPLPFADPDAWIAVRLTADGRFISGVAWPDEDSAVAWCGEDQDLLRDAEEDVYRRTGHLPAPMTPILRDAPVIALDHDVAPGGAAAVRGGGVS